MLRKAIAAVGIVLGVTAIGAPAHASNTNTNNTRTASFGTNGSVTLGYVNGKWRGSAHLVGLGKGSWVVYVGQFIDVNHDGVADSGSDSTLCKGTTGRNQITFNCKGVDANPLNHDGTWGDINDATVVRVTHVHHGATVTETVLENTFS